MLMPMLQAFDFPDCTKSVAVRNTTTVAPAALLLMNNDFFRDQARHFAQRVDEESGAELESQVEIVYLIALARPPTDEEFRIGTDFLASQAQSYAGYTPVAEQESTTADDAGASGTPNPIKPEHRTSALVNYCQAVMGLNEFIYID